MAAGRQQGRAREPNGAAKAVPVSLPLAIEVVKPPKTRVRSSTRGRKGAAGRASDGEAAALLADAGVDAEVLERLRRVEGKIAATQAAIAEGRPGADSATRLEWFNVREKARRQAELARADGDRVALERTVEAIVGDNDILLLGFLAAGLLAARSVGRVRGLKTGTGFLVSPTMFMTNNHVLPTADLAAVHYIDFEEFDVLGEHSATTVCALDPERFFFTERMLDVTLVALEDSAKVREEIEPLGWHPMVRQQGKTRVGDPVNIIQHPGGRTKSIVLHNSNLTHLVNEVKGLDPFCWYTSDTEPGSSGSPVFNNRWEVVAVHHRSIPATNEAGEIIDAAGSPIERSRFLTDPAAALFHANEGTRTSRIVKALQAWRPASSRVGELRDDLLSLWSSARLRNTGQEAAREAARRRRAPAGLESLTGPMRLARAGGPINIHFHIGY
jgi:endonuclease G